MSMHAVISEDIPAGAIIPDPAPEHRARLSGPALRTFGNVGRLWALSETERLALLGYPARSTLHKWTNDVRAERTVTLPFDTLMRLSALFGIYKGLRIVLNSDPEVAEWLRQPSTVLPFAGQSPLELMTEGGFEGLLLVRRYVDAWRSGAWLSPAERAGVPTAFAPSNIVFE
jgi:hypothetical protein